MSYIIWFDELTSHDNHKVGGKNASLSSLFQSMHTLGIRVPNGFALTTNAYWDFMHSNKLDVLLKGLLEKVHFDSYADLEACEHEIYTHIMRAPLPSALSKSLSKAYKRLSELYQQDNSSVAVRSSALGEDEADLSYAGQQKTCLAVQGIENLIKAYKEVIASLFTVRALAYRYHHGSTIADAALAVAVQKMINSTTAGVAFSHDTQTGLESVITLSASYGFGELVVQGAVVPDEVYIYKDRLRAGFTGLGSKILGSKEEELISTKNGLKRIEVDHERRERFCLTDSQILEIAHAVIAIEEAYQKKAPGAVDIEWAYNSTDNALYILQARPETVHRKKKNQLILYKALNTDQTPLLKGQAIGNRITSNVVHVLTDKKEASHFKQGAILVTAMTDPDWMPLLRKASGIITDRGGRTCHAAIVSRELGIPALVGTHNATTHLKTGDTITLDCSQGTEGYVYAGKLPYATTTLEYTALPHTLPVQLMINCADPSQALHHALLPADGIGLARLEFIITSLIGVHPLAIVHPERLSSSEQTILQKKAQAHESLEAFFINTLSQGVGMLAGAFYPRPVIVRLTDFKTNEYRDLLGGSHFESCEENPMLGFRGALRYITPSYKKAFSIECKALKKAREEQGFDNIILMVPFVRTVHEALCVLEELKSNGLEQGVKGLKIYMMVEIPSNVLLIDSFAHLFDGFSIGSNDLTQLTLGVDRDSGMLAPHFDERDPAMRKMLSLAIEGARQAGKPIGICGQAPSDFPELAHFLIDLGITSLSLNPDAVIPFLAQKAAPEHKTPSSLSNTLMSQTG